MKKKEFWKGFGMGLATLAICSFVWRSAFIQQWIPWQSLPFEVSMTKAAKINLIDNYLEQHYVDDVDGAMVEEGMYAGMLAGIGDRYTYYLTADSLNQYMQNANGHFEGIGVTVYANEEGGVTVFSLMTGAVAEIAGIMAGDIIKKVDDVDVTGMALGEVSERIRGEIGSSVRVTVYRPSLGEERTFEMKRGDIVVESVAGEMLQDNLGYIQLSGFKENTYEQFMKILEELKGQGMEGLILDLRNNPGGLVRSVYKIGEELLPQGLMVYTEDKQGKREELICDEKFLDIPMVILVNGNSASASEIFAGAAKDMDRATIVGTQTFGKGLVQRLFPLSDGSALNITIQKYFTPSGISIHGTGVTPDVVIEAKEEYADGMYIPKEDDTQLEEGIRQLTKEMAK